VYKFVSTATHCVYVVPTPNLWTAVVVGVAVGVFLGICLLFLLHCILQRRYTALLQTFTLITL